MENDKPPSKKKTDKKIKPKDDEFDWDKFINSDEAKEADRVQDDPEWMADWLRKVKGEESSDENK